MIYYLYKKTHRDTGLQYLGQTTQNPHEYKGSGVRWINHIKKHGYNVDTEILLETQNKENLSKMGIYYSELWNIVENKDWANLKPEIGDGGGAKWKLDTYAKRSLTMSKKTHEEKAESKAKEITSRSKKSSEEKKQSKVKRQNTWAKKTLAEMELINHKRQETFLAKSPEEKESMYKAKSNARKKIFDSMTDEEKSNYVKDRCCRPDTYTPERSKNISDALTGTIRTNESKKKQSNSRKELAKHMTIEERKQFFGGHNKGKPWTEARRAAHKKKEEVS
jgi:hypothetical protein